MMFPFQMLGSHKSLEAFVLETLNSRKSNLFLSWQMNCRCMNKDLFGLPCITCLLDNFVSSIGLKESDHGGFSWIDTYTILWWFISPVGAYGAIESSFNVDRPLQLVKQVSTTLILNGQRWLEKHRCVKMDHIGGLAAIWMDVWTWVAGADFENFEARFPCADNLERKRRVQVVNVAWDALRRKEKACALLWHEGTWTALLEWHAWKVKGYYLSLGGTLNVRMHIGAVIQSNEFTFLLSLTLFDIFCCYTCTRLVTIGK